MPRQGSTGRSIHRAGERGCAPDERASSVAPGPVTGSTRSRRRTACEPPGAASGSCGLLGRNRKTQLQTRPELDEDKQLRSRDVGLVLFAFAWSKFTLVGFPGQPLHPRLEFWTQPQLGQGIQRGRIETPRCQIQDLIRQRCSCRRAFHLKNATISLSFSPQLNILP